MATARSDPLRSTLDNLQLDPRSEADRPYLVAMLRRLGYTEREIDEVVRTGRMPTQAPADDGLAPPRDYRIVVPASDSRFALDNTGAGPQTSFDSPFEDLERVEFEDPTQDVEFEPLAEGDALAEAASAPDERAADAAGEGLQWDETQAQAGEGGEAADAQDWQQTTEAGGAEGLAEGQAGFQEGAIDTFGNPDAVAGAGNRTRVRVRRVRAGSREEAEQKVTKVGGRVLKSVPVDIVERWGPGSESDETKKGGQ